MRSDCHVHMVLDGTDWKGAIGRHRAAPDESWIRSALAEYQRRGFTYLQDGGDRWGVGAKARELAPEYGITYRTPLANLCKAGHYGGFIGEKYANFREYAALVRQHRRDGADFIKIMISGIMDFDRFGVLSEEGLPAGEIRELVHIAHEEGFSVMAHCNGARTAEAAAAAGWRPSSMGLTWMEMLWRLWQRWGRCGCRLCPPSGTSGERAVLMKMRCRRFFKALWKM